MSLPLYTLYLYKSVVEAGDADALLDNITGKAVIGISCIRPTTYQQ
jgi:hypothetical protein